MTARVRPAPGGPGCARARRNSCHRKIPVVRRRRPEEPGIQRAQPAPTRAGSWSTTISRSPNRRRLSSILRIVGWPAPFRSRPAPARAIQGRMAREADHYLAEVGRSFRDGRRIGRDAERSSAGGRPVGATPRPATVGPATCRRSVLRSIRSSRCCCGSPLAERISTRNTPSGRASPPGSIARRRFPSFNRPCRRTGIIPLRLDSVGRAPRWRTERTVREAGRSPTGTSNESNG